MKVVNTALKVIMKLFTTPFVTFLAGGILSTLVQILLEKELRYDIVVAVALLSVFVFYAIITIEKMGLHTNRTMKNNQEEIINKIELLHKDIFTQVQSLGLAVRWIPNPTIERDEGYELSLRIVQSAKFSIYIISDYSPQDRPISYTDERKEYLSAIAAVVRKHIVSNSQFEYKRILQTDNAGEINRILERRHLRGDEQTFDHCSEVVRSIQTNKSRVHVQFFASKPIPTSPSILLVDHKYILFTIPGKKGVIESTSSAYADLTTIGVLYMEDHTEKLATDFKRMFDSFAGDSVAIANVER